MKARITPSAAVAVTKMSMAMVVKHSAAATVSCQPEPLIPMGSVAASPMFIRSVPTPNPQVKHTVSPYGNFLDILSKDQKALWREMAKPADNHVRLNMNVTNSRVIVDLFQDRAITFRWMRFMRVPTNGTGSPRAFTKRSPGSKEIYAANLSGFKNLIEDFQNIILEQVMAFASWFMGDYNELSTLQRVVGQEEAQERQV